MNWDAINAIAEIAGLIVLVGTLFYLAIQIRDGNRIAQANSLQSILDGQRDRSIIPWIINPEIGDVFAAGLNSFESLSRSDQRRCFLTFTEIVLQMQNVMQLYEKDLVTEVEYESWLSFTSSLMTTSGGSQIWELMKKQLTPTIAKVIDDYLAAHPDAPSFLEINPLFRND